MGTKKSASSIQGNSCIFHMYMIDLICKIMKEQVRYNALPDQMARIKVQTEFRAFCEFLQKSLCGVIVKCNFSRMYFQSKFNSVFHEFIQNRSPQVIDFLKPISFAFLHMVSMSRSAHWQVIMVNNLLIIISSCFTFYSVLDPIVLTAIKRFSSGCFLFSIAVPRTANRIAKKMHPVTIINSVFFFFSISASFSGVCHFLMISSEKINHLFLSSVFSSSFHNLPLRIPVCISGTGQYSGIPLPLSVKHLQ